MQPIEFEKIEACGNDFVMLRSFPGKAATIAVCDRHHGIGADGVMILNEGAADVIRLDHYDADGSRSFCLNGVHAALRWLAESGLLPAGGAVESEGVSLRFVKDDPPRLSLEKRPFAPRTWRDPSSGEAIEGYFVDVGNPQFVLLDTLEPDRFRALAPHVRHDRSAFPAGVNVNLVYPADGEWRIHTFERGVEGFTLACGTGMLAAALILFAERGLKDVRFAPDGAGRATLCDRGAWVDMQTTAHWVASGVWRCA